LEAGVDDLRSSREEGSTQMTSTATKIAAGTSLVGLGGIAGLLLAPQQGDAERAAASVAQTPAPEVRTVHIKRVHHRTIHLKPKHEHHVAAAAAAPAAAPAPVPVVQSAPPPAPAPTSPIRTRTSGSGGSGSDDDGGHEHESEHEGGDD
jgi:hypothetical protein